MPKCHLGISEVFIEKRDLVTYNDLPPHLINAIIAAEDTSFFKHPGIDLYGIARAAVRNVLSMSKREAVALFIVFYLKSVFY